VPPAALDGLDRLALATAQLEPLVATLNFNQATVSPCILNSLVGPVDLVAAQQRSRAEQQSGSTISLLLQVVIQTPLRLLLLQHEDRVDTRAVQAAEAAEQTRPVELYNPQQEDKAKHGRLVVLETHPAAVEQPETPERRRRRAPMARPAPTAATVAVAAVVATPQPRRPEEMEETAAGLVVVAEVADRFAAPQRPASTRATAAADQMASWN
jgi:hypothetical protein